MKINFFRRKIKVIVNGLMKHYNVNQLILCSDYVQDNVAKSFLHPQDWIVNIVVSLVSSLIVFNKQ